jgi:hypothetical protein
MKNKTGIITPENLWKNRKRPRNLRINRKENLKNIKEEKNTLRTAHTNRAAHCSCV